MNEVELYSKQMLVTLNAFLLLKKYEGSQDVWLFNLKKHLAFATSISQGLCRLPGCRNTHYCQLFHNRISSYIWLFSFTMHRCREAQDMTGCGFVLLCFGATSLFSSVPLSLCWGWGPCRVAKLGHERKERKHHETLKGSADELLCILEHFKKDEIKSWSTEIAWRVIVFETELCLWEILGKK